MIETEDQDPVEQTSSDDLADRMDSSNEPERGLLAAIAFLIWLAASVVVAWATGLSSSWGLWLIFGFMGVLIYLGYIWLVVWLRSHDWFNRPRIQTLDIGRQDKVIHYYETPDEDEGTSGKQ